MHLIRMTVVFHLVDAFPKEIAWSCQSARTQGRVGFHSHPGDWALGRRVLE